MLEHSHRLPSRVARWALVCLASIAWPAPYADAARGAVAATPTPPAPITEPIEVNTSPDAFDWWIAGAQMLASLAALAGLLFLASQVKRAKEQISDARDAAKAERALAFQQRFTSREFSRIVSPVLAFFNTTDAADCVDKVRGEVTSPHAEDPCLPRTPRHPGAPHACINDVAHVLSFFEDLGTAHDEELINRDVLRLSFGNAPVQIFMAAWWYIAWEREGGLGTDTSLYLEFEKLVRWLLANEPEFSEFTPNLAARLIVLPRDERGASWATWELCRDLSHALSEYRAPTPETHVAAAAAAVEKVVGEPADGVADSLFGAVIPVPPGLDVDPVAWAEEREHARRLQDLLAGLDPHVIAVIIGELKGSPSPAR
jgi:hypothetical protein